jgi:lipopolysaccharide transport system ATP-binding protein
MSSDRAVVVDGVSKLYRIGATVEQRSFRETLSDFVAFRHRRGTSDVRDLWALSDVSFDVPRGEAVGIIGRNGAGKSTLLKILSRITEPTGGRIVVRGRVSSLLEVGTGFHAELTGRENIQLNGAILGMTRREIRERFEEIVAFAEVERFIDTPVKYYSSGMYMRLAFAVAAHLEPDILVVDEVLAVGDAAFQAKCLRKMNDVASHGRTVLFVSHNMPAVKALCQHAVWLDHGKVVEIGASEAVVNRYLQETAAAGDLDEVARQITELPPDPFFRLLDVRTVQDGQTTTSLLNGSPAQLVVDYDVGEPTYGLHVFFRLYTLDEMLIFESIHDGTATSPQIVRVGRHLTTATLPADFLAPRPYELRVSVAIHNVRELIPPIRLRIDVQASGIVNRAYPGYVAPGAIAPLIAWETEMLPSDGGA